MKTPLSTRFELELSLMNTIFLIYGIGLSGLAYATFTSGEYLHGGFQLVLSGVLVFLGCKDATVSPVDSSIEKSGE